MKALFINGSPRRNRNTFKMLDSAMKGAAEAGAEVELVHLYDSSFKGCISCLACKTKNAKTNGLCAFKDPLTPVLEKAHDADIVVIGSPIYFSYPTGSVRSFLERFMYPILSYGMDKDEETGEPKKPLMPKTKATAMIYTMGDIKENTDKIGYPVILGENERFLKQLFGYSETLCSHQHLIVFDFKGYSDDEMFGGADSTWKKQMEEQSKKDLESAYELGKRLVHIAAEQ